MLTKESKWLPKFKQLIYLLIEIKINLTKNSGKESTVAELFHVKVN